jgi:hypothetical protein
MTRRPNLSSALLRTSVFEESTSIRWNRLTIANDAADLLQQTEALHSAGIEFIVATHKSWKERGRELWLMVPSNVYSRAPLLASERFRRKAIASSSEDAHRGNVEQ